MQRHDRENARKAWTSIWGDQPAGSRCLEGASPALTAALLGHWTAFGRSLPFQARVLDVGCGGGAVAQWLTNTCDHTTFVGVDIAEVRSPGHPRIALLSNTSMEELPFEPQSFDAATSQFGFEYGRVRQAAGALARVLRPASPLSFLVHHSESVIVQTGRLRLLVLKALARPNLRDAFLAGDVRYVVQTINALKTANPLNKLLPVVEQALIRRINNALNEKVRAWDLIQTSIAPELVVLQALLTCAIPPMMIGRWVEPLHTTFDMAEPTVLRQNEKRPIAWVIRGEKRS